MSRNKPWEIAADLESASHAILAAAKALDAIHPDALPEVEQILGTGEVNRLMAKDLQALSDKYQAIADAEVEA